MENERPALRVVRGEPSDAELAALTAVVAGLATRPEPGEQPPRSGWGAKQAGQRRMLRPGPGAWRASALPH